MSIFTLTGCNEMMNTPTKKVEKLLSMYQTKDEEVLNKSQIFVTTAGWKNTFAYDKLIQMLVG